MAKNINEELDLMEDLNLDDDLDIDFEDDDFDLEETEVNTQSKDLSDDEFEDELSLDDVNLDFDEEEIDDLELDEEPEVKKPVAKKETKKPAVKKEVVKEDLVEDEDLLDFDEEEFEEVIPEEVVKPKATKPVTKKETKKPVAKKQPVVKKEEVVEEDEEEVVETTKTRSKSAFQTKLEMAVDKRNYTRLFDTVVMSKVNAYNDIQKDRAKGKTSRIPTSKAISRADFAALIKAKVYSDEKYLKTFIKLFVSAGLDQDDAVNALLKDKLSNKAFSELYELFTETMEDVLKAEAGVVLLAKEDIRATLTAEYKSEEIRDISSLKKTDKYTHVRKSDYYKVTCKSPVLQSKIEGGNIDKNGNFVPVKK